VFEPFTLPFVQEGLIEILLLSVAAGLAGTWVVLRGLSFYSHAIGTASFPGLVLADGLGFPAAAGAFGMAAVFTILSALVGRSRRTATDSATALVLVACMAAGVILASDVFSSGANIDTLLFGSLLSIDARDMLLAGAAAVISIVAVGLFSHHWLAKGFDAESAPSLKSASSAFDMVLLAVVAFTVIAALNAVGALLVSALIVLPAATVRMVTSRVNSMQIYTVLLVAAEGTVGLWLCVKTNAPPGATIAVVSGVVFTIVAIARAIRRTAPTSRTAAKVVAVSAAALVFAGLIGGCGSGSDGSGELKVTATTTQVADFVSEVGGNRIDLNQILQPNTDPHEYEPRPSDVASVADSAIIFRSGGHLDDWVSQLVDDSGSDAEVVDLSSGIPVKREEDENGSTELDPHWWHDASNVEAAVGEIEVSLSKADPGNAAYFKSNASDYLAQVAAVDAGIRKCVSTVPKTERKIVTDHDAFGYFTDRYGIESVGTVIPAMTTEAQPSAGDLADLDDTIRRENVKAIFPEESVSAKLSEAIARDTGASTDYTLYGDTLGPEDSSAGTWIGMEKWNADNLVLGMTGGVQGCDFHVD